VNTVIDGILTNYQLVNPQAKKDCLVLHGWGHHSGLWLNLCSLLNNQYRYILLDLPGAGGTHFLPADKNDIPEYSKFVSHFLAKLKIRKTIIIGHSFGGQIATHLCVTQPGLVTRLILISPALIRRKTLSQKFKIYLYSQFQPLKKIIPHFILENILKTVSSSDYYHSSPRHKSILKKIVNFDLTNLISQIKVPTDIIWGDLDKEIPFHAKYIVEKLPQGRLRILYGTGHNPHLTDPDNLKDVINQSLP